MPEIAITLLTAGVVLAARRLGRARTDSALLVLALLAGISYFDFFDFHGDGHFLHDHDAGHYYLGARYFQELGYTGLYGAMLAAEVEATGGTVAREARDLATGRVVPAAWVLHEGQVFRDRFSESRWHDFRRDADAFRQALGPLYPNFVLDQGFNTPPLWAWGAGALASLVSPGDRAGLLALTLLDLALLAAMLVAIGHAFGRRPVLLASIFLCTTFGAHFDWLGGSFLRFAWLASLVLGAAALQLDRHRTAGALLAVSACLRLFPAIFMIGAAAQVVASLLGRRTPERRPIEMLLSFGLTSATLVGATLLTPHHGWAAWRLFAANMDVYLEATAYNLVGLGLVTSPLYEAISLHPGAGAAIDLLLGLVVLALAARLAAGRRGVEAMALGCPALFALVDMAVYYSLVFVLILLAHRHTPHIVARLFATEAAAWTAGLILGPGTPSHVAHSLLLLLFFGATYVDEVLDACGKGSALTRIQFQSLREARWLR